MSTSCVPFPGTDSQCPSATQIAVIGATIALPGASSDSGPLSTYILDGSQNSAFVYSADVKNVSGVAFFVSENLTQGEHTLEISILSVSDKAPFLLDAIALRQPDETATTSAVWVSTVFVTPTSAPSNLSNNVATSGGSSMPIGAIVGGVIGGVALLVGAALAFYFLYYRPRHRHHDYRGFSSTALFDEGMCIPYIHHTLWH